MISKPKRRRITMTKPQLIRVANLGQVLLGGLILALQVAGLIRGRNDIANTDVGSPATL